MNKQEFLHIIMHPSDISEREAEALEEMTVNFPYCQIAHALLAKYAHEKGSMLALQKLKNAAVYSVSRTALKNLIYSETTWYSTPSRVLSSVINSVPDDAEVLSITPLPYTEPVQVSKSLEEDISNAAAQWVQTEELRKSILHKPAIDEVTPAAKTSDNPVIDELKATIEEQQRTKKEMAAQKRSEDTAETPNDAEASDNASSVNFSEKPDRQVQVELIDRFIVSNPRMPQAGELAVEEDEKGDLASESSRINETLVSENLAVILTKQGKISKAIEIYRKLILKYPEKSSYFASRIESLEKIG